MSKWIGYAVSVNCGEPLGCYQGTILEADGSTITLNKAFRNGFPYPKSQVTLNAADIKELKIIESKSEPSEQTHSTVTVSKNKKGARATVCESLQNNPSNSGNQPPQNVTSGNKGNRSVNKDVARSKPIDIQQTNRNSKSNTHNTQTGSYGNTGSTPKVRHNTNSGMRRRDEACFGDGAEPAVQEFDFEGNLALFNKQALWEQMPSRPDVVLPASGPVGPVGAVGARAGAALELPAELRGAGRYLTEGGLVVPAASAPARARLWRRLQARGLDGDARLLLARAAADVCLRLVGGWRRLEGAAGAAGAVALAAGRAGAAALAALRLLHEHSLNIYVHVPECGAPCPAMSRELALLAECGALPLPLGALPAADIVLLALSDPRPRDPRDPRDPHRDPRDPHRDPRDPHRHEQQPYAAALRWAAAARGGVVALEPDTEELWPGLVPRAALGALWPGAAGGAPRLYLVGAGAPRGLYRDLGMPAPPLSGAVLPLYPLH